MVFNFRFQRPRAPVLHPLCLRAFTSSVAAAATSVVTPALPLAQPSTPTPRLCRSHPRHSAATQRRPVSSCGRSRPPPHPRIVRRGSQTYYRTRAELVHGPPCGQRGFPEAGGHGERRQGNPPCAPHPRTSDPTPRQPAAHVPTRSATVMMPRWRWPRGWRAARGLENAGGRARDSWFLAPPPSQASMWGPVTKAR